MSTTHTIRCNICAMGWTTFGWTPQWHVERHVRFAHDGDIVWQAKAYVPGKGMVIVSDPRQHDRIRTTIDRSAIAFRAMQITEVTA